MSTKGPAASIRRFVYRIDGMDCAEEVAILKKELGKLVNAETDLVFDLLSRTLQVQTSDPSLTSNDFVDAIARTGMKPKVCDDKENQGEQRGLGLDVRTLLTALSGLCILVAVLIQAITQPSIAEEVAGFGLAKLFYLLGVIAGLILVFPKAWFAASQLRPDMHLLMFVAVIGAIVIGEWFEAAAISCLFSISLLLEHWSVERARKAISKLFELVPPVARKKFADGEVQEIEASQVNIGDVIIVSPAEKIPVDGIILKGSSEIDQSSITGESVPVFKAEEDAVFAGTINGNGNLEIRSTHTSDDTTLAKIIRLVGEAQSKRATAEKWVERFARIYTPVVLALAVLIFLVPGFLTGYWQVWFYRSLVLLVIACPCALVISTPVCIVAALTSAARAGVLIKGGVFLEVPASIRALALDKTGTLTEGKPKVVEIIAFDDHTQIQVLSRVAALESHSSHPLALAVINEAESRKIDYPQVDDFELIPGKGARGVIEKEGFWIGAPRLFRDQIENSDSVAQHINQLSDLGFSVIVLGKLDHVCGVIGLADTVRPQARNVVLQLHSLGIEKVVMLTGDNPATAEKIASQAGIDSVHSELLPEDKVERIEELEAKYGSVAMVGDGVNDAPALARASLGIAMAKTGSDATIESADITLMSDDLDKIPWLVKHSKRTLATIRQNVFFALGIKSLLVGLAILGYSSLWAAIAGDMGTSLLVIFNGLRLLKTQYS